MRRSVESHLARRRFRSTATSTGGGVGDAVVDDVPCLLGDVPHGRHEWTPAVADPAHPQVLHIFTDAPLTCPGVPNPTKESPR